MALNRLPPIDQPTPRWSDLDTHLTWELAYDKKTDTLFIRAGEPRAATAVMWGDDIWLELHPVSGEIFGFHIEDFRKVFLVRHPDLANAWPQMNAKKTPEAQKTTWLEVLIEYIRSTLGKDGGHPQQPRLKPSL